jgi:hypothetical protein
MKHKRHKNLDLISLTRTFAATLLLVCVVITASAQETTSVAVKVTDANGAVVPGVEVSLINEATHQTLTRITNADGLAVFNDLAPGLYTVKAHLRGFKVMQQTGIQVTIGRVSSVPLTMSSEGVQKFLADLVTSTTQEALQELSSIPNINNDLTPLLQIIPGAVATGSSSLGRVTVDGRGIDQQTARLDGVDFTALLDFPSADSAVNPVSSFQKPEVAGDFENATTRSGAFGYEPRHGPGTGSVSETSTFKGQSDLTFQVYTDLRNDALNARNFFDYDGENGLRRNRFGGKVGDSFGENRRTQLFFAYDGSRGRTERNVYEAVPVELTNGTATGPLALLAGDFLPAGTSLNKTASLDSDFVIASRRLKTKINSNAWDLRFDHFPWLHKETFKCPAPTPKECSNLTVRLTHQLAENDAPDGITGRHQLQRFFFTNGLVSWKSVTTTKPVLSPYSDKPGYKEFGHQFKFGFNQTRAEVTIERPSTNPILDQSIIATAGAIKTQGLPLTPPLEGQLATVPIASPGGLHPTLGRGLYVKPQSFSVIYDFSKLATSDKMHELYAGIEARFIRFNFDRLGGLTYNFPGVLALRTGKPRTVLFLSDLSSPSPFSDGSGPRQAQQEMYMGYFQMVSQFRKGDPALEPAITLTYGVRYDHFGRVRERDNRSIVVDPLTGAMELGAKFYRVDHANVQPRIGVSYRFGDEGAGRYTVLRAGVGLYSGVPRISELTLPIESDRFSTGIKDGSVFPMLPSEVVRVFNENPLTRQFQPLAFAKDFSPLERSLKWDIKLTRSHNGYDFSAYYIGNIGRNLALANFANRILSVNTNADPTQDAIVIREFDIVNGNSISQPLGEFFYRRGGGSSSFNALTLQVGRNLLDANPNSNPWGQSWLKLPVQNFTVKYTLSRSVGNVSGTIMSNPLDPDADFGNNSGVPRHGFVWTTAYNLWKVKEKANEDDFWLGWKINTNLKVTSGLPLTVRLQRPDVVYVDGSGNVFTSAAPGRTARLNTPRGGGSTSAFMPNLIPGENPYKAGFADRRFLDPTAFAIPAPGELGNVRRGQFFGPPSVQLDLVFRRNFFSSERLKTLAEFQVEIFNVFNHTNFSTPPTLLNSRLGTSAANNELQPGVAFTHAAAGSFGVINAAEAGRIIQFSFTFKFNKGFTK